MEKEGLKNNNSTSSSGPTNHHRERVGLGIRTGDGPSNGGRSLTETRTTTPSEFFLQWGIRKRLRCMKIQMKDGSITPVSRKTVRVDRRVVRADKNGPAQTITTTNNGNGGGGYFNLPQQAPPPIPLSNRVLRNSEGMRGQGNGAVEQRAHDKKGGHNHSNHHHHNNNNSDNNNNLGGVCSGASSENNRDSKKGGSSGSEALPAVWPPKFVIALTNKEKEEDFMVLKGSKLPQRPKKRTKFLQRTLNLVSPGSWLCDLTLERYEVREKKTSKKRPRGLKAMNNMESDSE